MLNQVADRTTSNLTALRLAAVLLLTGQVLYILITQFHAGGEANHHSTIFNIYADSDIWKAVHVGQFLAMSGMVAGLYVLALTFDGARAVWSLRLGSVFAGVALALYAVLQAVDGVGNQEVDAAWVSAQSADKSARFASAEGMRWLEWGMRSYHNYALGLALLLLAFGAWRAAAFPAALAVLMGASGVAYLAQGWVVGAEGFSGTNTVLILVAWAFSLAWMLWMLVVARRGQQERAGAMPR